MADTQDQITNLDAELDALSSPTTSDVYARSRDYDADVVAASAVARAVAGGGGGGSQPGALLIKDFLFSEEAGGTQTDFAITAVNQGSKEFTLVGDQRQFFNTFGASVTVTGSTGNDGTYTTSTAFLSGGDTVVVVQEAIPDATADGAIRAFIKTYSATLDLPAGSTVVDVVQLPINNAWAADGAVLLIGDEATGPAAYFAGGFAGTWPSDLPDYTPGSLSFNLTVTGSGAYANGVSLFNPGQSGGGFGVYYAADDTLTLLLGTIAQTAVVAPTGIWRVRVYYTTPPTTVVPAVT